MALVTGDAAYTARGDEAFVVPTLEVDASHKHLEFAAVDLRAAPNHPAIFILEKLPIESERRAGRFPNVRRQGLHVAVEFLLRLLRNSAIH